MNRHIVKQASSMFRIEELDFEATAFTSKGGITHLLCVYLIIFNLLNRWFVPEELLKRSFCTK